MPLTNKLILCGLLAGLITGTRSTGYAQSRPPANSAIAWTTGGTIEKGKLVLRGVNSVTVCFTDRPARLAAHMPTSKLVPPRSQAGGPRKQGSSFWDVEL